MAKCVFCGEKASPVVKVEAAQFVFKACQYCAGKYEGKDRKTIIKAVLDAGFYGDPYVLSDWLREDEEKHQEIIDELKENIRSYEEWREGRECGKCPKCGGDMLRMDPDELVTHDRTILSLANLSELNTSGLEMERHVCELCGYTEWYSLFQKKRHEGYLNNKDQLEKLSQPDADQ